ncbi:MAG: three-Cys-motif partner protein TcmP [Candidatus Glassbacteria bacterium]|nr:three-Cys-motif partner protein TcmP [Candidatus Glassbacteria bacterium]
MDEVIRRWSQDKINLLCKYAKAYSGILSKTSWEYVYIDAFAGYGEFVTDKNIKVPGSPIAVLEIEPPFTEYYFFDVDQENYQNLKALCGSRDNVYIYWGDCNKMIPELVFPNITKEQGRKGLCFLDPKGIHIDWKLVELAGKLQTIEVLIHFSIYDLRRNIFPHKKSKIKDNEIQRMNKFWGDNSWQDIKGDIQSDLFDEEDTHIADKNILEAYKNRLQAIANFRYVSDPLPMKTEGNSVLYYLIFATQNRTGLKIINDIFKKYLKSGNRNG